MRLFGIHHDLLCLRRVALSRKNLKEFSMRAFVIVLLLTLLAWPSLAEAAKKRHCRDAQTGRYVSEKYAFWHPTTTVCERVKHK